MTHGLVDRLDRAWAAWDARPGSHTAIGMEQACADVAGAMGITPTALRALLQKRAATIGRDTTIARAHAQVRAPSPSHQMGPPMVHTAGRYGAVGPELDPPPRHLGDLVELALGAGVDQLWATPAAVGAWGLPDRARVDTHDRGAGTPHAFADAPGYRFDVVGLGPWIEGRRDGTPGRRREVAVVFPGWSSKTPRRWRTLDAAELVRALDTFEAAVGLPWANSGGSVGRRLMRAVHGRGRADPPTVVDLPAELRRAEGPWVWGRRPAERKGWVHCLDANATYLAACSRLRLGWGQPSHRTLPDFDPALPGYWKLGAPLTPSSRGAPNPFPAGPWVATPTLELAAELGVGFDVLEAWTWDDAVDWLTPWYERLRDARARLIDDPALDGVKACYTEALGWLGAGYGGSARPDWYAHVRAKARSNLYRRCRRDGIRPFAVDTDMVWYVSASRQPDVPIGAAPREWKHEGTVELSKVLELDRPTRGQLRPYLDALAEVVGAR